jgi:NTP pyrophosphatase (non-canonical NTP hydrolase)
MTLNILAKMIHRNALNKGFWQDQIIDGEVKKGNDIPTKLCLIHSEISEALEDYRNGYLSTTINNEGKPEGLPSELIDIIIRTLDLAEYLNIDMEQEFEIKFSYNILRPYMHGGKKC